MLDVSAALGKDKRRKEKEAAEEEEQKRAATCDGCRCFFGGMMRCICGLSQGTVSTVLLLFGCFALLVTDTGATSGVSIVQQQKLKARLLFWFADLGDQNMATHTIPYSNNEGVNSSQDALIVVLPVVL